MSKTQTYAFNDGSTIEVAKDSEFELVAKLLKGMPINEEIRNFEYKPIETL